MTTLAEYEESERELELELQEIEMAQRSTEFEVSCHVIPHDKQRVPNTIDDWQVYMGRITVRVSAMPDIHYQRLAALHGLVEALLCYWDGIDEKAVDAWDLGFEEDRKHGRVYGEPGDDPNAPYHKQHHIASIAEMLAAEHWGVDWNEYTAVIDDLNQK